MDIMEQAIDKQNISFDLLRLLTKWIKEHILQDDMAYRQFLQKKTNIK